jgi:C-methyltransferase C-terminal domain/Methyltransferase domain/Putative zinc binding domain
MSPISICVAIECALSSVSLPERILTQPTSRPIVACQACGKNTLSSVLFVGYIPPVNTMPEIGSVPYEQPAYPLELLTCTSCGLAQIGLEVDPVILFPPSYPYRSNSTRILRDNFADLYRNCREMFALGSNDLCVDIGSNDGTLLSNFHNSGHPVLGIEPSLAADDANARNIRTRMTFFSKKTAEECRAEFGAARIITAANVFAHIGNVHAVIDGITALLRNDGAFISENHYLLSLIETLQYDTIYHEHLRYYHLAALKPLLEAHGLEIFHVQRIPTHGGSIRVYSAFKGQQTVRPSVAQAVKAEEMAGLLDGSALKSFRRRVVQSKLDLYRLLADIKRRGERIYGIGAPSRASTLINYVGLDDGVLDCVMEIASSPKVGKYIPGTRIPVLDEQKLFDDQPEYALLLSWHIADELVENLRRKRFGGKFVVPLAEPRILS